MPATPTKNSASCGSSKSNKRRFFFAAFCAAGALALLSGCERLREWSGRDLAKAQPELIVLTYSSMTAPGGLGDKIRALFDASGTGVALKWATIADTPQFKLKLQGEAQAGLSRISMVVGLDRWAWKELGALLEPMPGFEAVCRALEPGLPCEPTFLPYDYSPLTWIARVKPDADGKAAASGPLPISLAEPRFGLPAKARVSLPDPRLSGVGRGLLATLEGLRKSDPQAWQRGWAELAPNLVMKAPGWDQSYAAFVKGEADWTWSFATSEARHRSLGQNDVHAVSIKEGHVRITEGFSYVHGVFPEAVLKARQALAEVILSEALQKELPKANWMLPARSGVKLPEEFSRAQALPAQEAFDVLIDAREAQEQWRNSVSAAR